MAAQAYLVEFFCLNLMCLAIWTVLCDQNITKNCERKLDSISCNGAFPDTIPNGVFKVECIFPHGEYSINITTDLFIDETWINVDELIIRTYPYTTIRAKAFQRLANLTTLGLHAYFKAYIETSSFEGLQSLRVLDVSYSRRFSLDTIIDIFKEKGIMPQVDTLIISGINMASLKSLNISRQFLATIATTKIATIDISNTAIQELPLDDIIDLLCNRRLQLICSHRFLNYMGVTYRKCRDFHLVDLRFAKLGTLVQPFIQQNAVLPVGGFVKWFDLITHINTLFLDGVLDIRTPYIVRNVSLIYMGKDTMTNSYLSFASNRISYLDVKILNMFHRIETMDFSSNDMGYIQPQLLPEQNSLRQLVLSNNNLNLMATKNSTDFQHLTKIYKHLQTLYLNNNRLSFLPAKMFDYNSDLQFIDLSNNLFEQIYFTLHEAKNLQHLNMSANKITILSRYSIDIIQIAVKRNTSFTIDLRHNDILCNECKCKDFIEWIISEKNAIITDATCYNGNTAVPIDKKVLSDIISMCQLKRRIILACSLAVSISLILSLFIFVSVKAFKKYLATSVRKYNLKQIRDDKHKFRFVTFLAFSGDDEDFVEDNLKVLLEAQLRETVGTDRELICTGDSHFELGHTIADQMDISCQTCGSVIFVVSESFCRSPHCNNELNIAYVNQKPIILMFKEHIDKSSMSPLLKVVFKQFTRLTWKVKDNKYTLSASWKHICDSLIDNMRDS